MAHVLPDLTKINDDLKIAAIAEGIVDATSDPEAYQAFLDRNAALVPINTATDYNATTTEQKAWLAVQIAAGTLNDDENPGATQPPAAPKSSNRKAKSRPVSTLTTAQEAALQKHVQDTLAAKSNVSTNSVIPNFYVAKPTSNEYIDAGTTGALKAESWKALTDKIASGEYVVVDDFDGKEGKKVPSKSNYDILVQAAASKASTIPVMRNDKVGASIGYEVNIVETPGGKPTNKILPKTTAKQFVQMKTAGYIMATDGTMGVQLKTITKRGKGAAAQDESRVVLSDTNKKAAIKAGAYKAIRDVKPEMEDKTVKADLVFYVNKHETKKDAEGKVQVLDTWMRDSKGAIRKFAIRASVTAQVHKLELNPQYEGIFPTGAVDPTKPLTGEDLAKVAAATVSELACTLSNKNVEFLIDDSLKDALKELQDVVNTPAATPTVGV